MSPRRVLTGLLVTGALASLLLMHGFDTVSLGAVGDLGDGSAAQAAGHTGAHDDGKAPAGHPPGHLTAMCVAVLVAAASGILARAVLRSPFRRCVAPVRAMVASASLPEVGSRAGPDREALCVLRC